MDAEFEAWWQKTWGEREELLWDHYGPSHPRGSAEGHVLAFPSELRRAYPGACAYVFRPTAGTGQRLSRATWSLVTHALTQPQGPDAEDPQGESGHGWEFGVEATAPARWATGLLQLLLHEVAAGARLGVGHRVAFFLGERAGVLRPYLGQPDDHDVEPHGELRWLLLFPHLRPWVQFHTGAGAFSVLTATGLTEDEFALLDDVGRCGFHLQLLLCERGVGQVTAPERPSVLALAAGRRAWDRIRALTPDEAWGEVVSRFAVRPGGPEDWPFADAPSAAAFTLTSVMRDGAEIVHVTHDAEDGAWQFLDEHGARDEDIVLASLACVLRRDPSLRDLAELPLGWRAFRDGPGLPWRWERK